MQQNAHSGGNDGNGANTSGDAAAAAVNACIPPWTVVGPGQLEKPCECRPQKPPRPKRTPPKIATDGQDCCEQLVKVLAEHLGVQIPLHKPKTSNKIKTSNWCSELPTKMSSVPLLLLILRRHLADVPVANELEAVMREWLVQQPPHCMEALRRGLEAYDNLPSNLRDCLFETRFDNLQDDCLLDPSFIGAVLRAEMLTMGIKHLYPRSLGIEGPGLVRMWERPVGKRIDEINREMVLGPWPWICNIDPGADGRDIYRNNDVFVPGTIEPVIFQEHEFEKECEVRPVPGEPSKVRVDCWRKSANSSSSGGGNGFSFASSCSGGPAYRFSGSAQPADGSTPPPWCLSVPAIYPGDAVALSGFNFFSENCKVVVRRTDGAFPDITLPCAVYGDRVTVAVLNGQPAAVCDVNDIVAFTLPYEVRQGPNSVRVPPGRYAIQVLVNNTIKFAPEPGTAPDFLASNVVFVDVQPARDAAYRVWTDHASCYQETPGWGSDEPWFKAFVYRLTLKPSAPPVVGSIDLFRTSDVDSGEGIAVGPVDLFNGSLGELGILSVGIIGVEIDSDDAAENEVTSFGDAYLEYLKRWYTALAMAGATGLGTPEIQALIATGKATTTLWAAGAALLAIAGLGVFYAMWAPADPIGYDFFVFDNTQLSNATDDKERDFAEYAGDVHGVYRSIHPYGKRFNPEHTEAIYTEEHRYVTNDKSHYGITFHISRSTIPKA